MGLENINVITGRGRELARKDEFKNRFDVVLARAVSDAGTVLREVRGMLADESELILYKSPESADTELRGIRASKSVADLEWSVSGIFNLPNEMGKRVFLRGSKVTSDERAAE
jgi:16S rRNA G527 N7-methylase RsmG